MPSCNLMTRYLLLLWVLTIPWSHASIPESMPPQTFELISMSVIRDNPQGRIKAVWDPKTRFTATARQGEWLRISGTFPNDQWTPLPQPLWIHRYYAAPFSSYPPVKKSKRPKGSQRYITIDKTSFSLHVVQQHQGKEEIIYQTQVALGMDRCLSPEKGGKCYFTDPGEYQVRWKIEDDQGIEWCIPKSMEAEFAEDIAKGERCFRGSIGTRALNIGKSYAIHGTSNPSSIGKRASHGCIRTVNNDMSKIYEMMDVGDRVVIHE